MSENDSAVMSVANFIFDLIPQRDPRTSRWALTGNKTFLITLILGYVYIVKYAGPRFMSNRRPYDNLKPVIALHNLFMVLLNSYFLKNFLTRTYLGGGYNVVCQGIDFQAKDATTSELLELCWWYLWVRVADLLDTTFFVLRKKYHHVSFLHVVHHILVVISGWYGLAFGADGQSAMLFIINSFVHIVMYFYYLLSLLGPAARPYLWWKRYLTQLQIVQFVIAMIHINIPLFVNCGFPKTHALLGIGEAVFFFVMFTHFYLKTYRGKQLLSEVNGLKNKAQ